MTYFKPDPTAAPGTTRAAYRFECDACHGTRIAHDLANPDRRLIGPGMWPQGGKETDK